MDTRENTELKRREFGLLLQNAIEKKDEGFVTSLIGAGASMSLVYDDNKNQALHLAMKSPQNSKIVRLLLDAKANPLAKNLNNKLPILMNISNMEKELDKEYWEGIKTFAEALKNSPDIDIRDMLGQALFVAVLHDKLDIAKILLDAGANSEAYSSEYGDRVLHTAVRKHNTQMIFLLLMSGIDPLKKSCKVKNNESKIPLALARELNNMDAARAFIAYERYIQIRTAALQDILHYSQKWLASNMSAKFFKIANTTTSFSEFLSLLAGQQDYYLYRLCQKHLEKLIDLGNQEPIIPITKAAARFLKPRVVEKKLENAELSKEMTMLPQKKPLPTPLPSAPLASELTFNTDPLPPLSEKDNVQSLYPDLAESIITSQSSLQESSVRTPTPMVVSTNPSSHFSKPLIQPLKTNNETALPTKKLVYG